MGGVRKPGLSAENHSLAAARRRHGLVRSAPDLRRLGKQYRRATRTLREDERATAAIEFAICVVPLITLVLGAVTYAGVIAAYLDISHAADEGAREAIGGVTLCERQSIAESATRSSLIFGSYASAATITATVTSSQIQVDITLPYAGNSITPILFPAPSTLTASAIANTDGPEFPAPSC